MTVVLIHGKGTCTFKLQEIPENLDETKGSTTTAKSKVNCLELPVPVQASVEETSLCSHAHSPCLTFVSGIFHSLSGSVWTTHPG